MLAKLLFSMAFSPDGKQLASAGADGTVKVWDAATGQETRTLYGHTGFVYSVAFSPDGQRLASASLDKTVKVCDVATGRETRSLTGHTANVEGVAFSPNSKRLVSAGADQTVKIWDAATGQETLSLKTTGGATSVAFSPDGWRIAAGARSQTVTVWDARPLEAEPNRSPAANQAQRVVRSLFAKLFLREDVLDSLRAKSDLSEPVRAQALDLAQRYPVDAQQLNNMSWNIASPCLG